MPTVSGTVTRIADSESKFVATFTVNGLRQIFTGNLSESLPTFTTSSASLNYSSTNDLTGTRVFEGIIGATTLKLTFGDGPIITGDLSASVGMAFSVNGSGPSDTALK
ncbi:hypothetical protein CERSUDRAFT_96303 [Gelatoporia subvermispora B]|uniref:Uncharacterized protein n=1 Tax=Ceriporiopsis subvermispora (strain B) TaxID=914234 RepID=M2RCE8_CERS8|nr:hypothetical protein CERSUDRAFT_96303 [Gelatoporia subvermispora B]